MVWGSSSFSRTLERDETRGNGVPDCSNDIIRVGTRQNFNYSPDYGLSMALD